MSDEFALCWNNFTDNITSGFHSLLFRGDLYDVTLAVDGKLLKAHKVVLSICSPYFQEMFASMPQNTHPILILKDMSATLVSNLLEFMYQGSVNVKQEELQAFMKIAETLQIKGLTTTSTKEQSSKSSAAFVERNVSGVKRIKQQGSKEKPKSEERRSAIDLTSDDDMEMQLEDKFNVQTHEISMKSRFDDTNQKLLIPLPHNGNNVEAHSSNKMDSIEPSNEANLLVEISSVHTSFSTDTDPNKSPSGSGITMLSSTSLLHGNCVFNRNNTVATQAGLKTYWLCKSYRVSMCKARCITHQGKVISATGVHNHQPHMDEKTQDMVPRDTENLFNHSTVNDHFSISQSASLSQYSGQSMISKQGNNYFTPSLYQTSVSDYYETENSNQIQ